MEYLYIKGSHTIGIKRNSKDDPVESIWVNEKEYKLTDEEEGLSLDEKCQELKRSSYKGFLSRQFENIIFLTGAGSSVKIGEDAKKGRLLSELWKDVENKVGSDNFNQFIQDVKYTDITESGEVEKNLEKLLSTANAAKNFVEGKEDSIQNTITIIETEIKEKCQLLLPNDAPHIPFIEKITLRKSTLPRAKIFTLNYDTLFEQAGRKGNFVIIDGFSFSSPRYFSGRNFDHDIVLRDRSRLKEEDNFINRVFHLYKLHGSVDWEKDDKGIFQKDNSDSPLMIYPKDSKYESSYEQPFFELMSRFHQSLRQQNVLLVCMGFSFGDKHVVSAIKEALGQNSGFQLMVVNRSIKEKGDLKWLFDEAKRRQNVVLVAEEFKDFAIHFPTLKSYQQEDNLSE